MKPEIESLSAWMRGHGMVPNGATTLQELLDKLGVEMDSLKASRDEAVTRAQAAEVHLASIRKLCEARWPHGKPCPLCGQIGRHSGSCYARGSTGYDLLNEHEATIRENDELRDALARHLPVNGAAIRAGGKYRSLRERVQRQFGTGPSAGQG